MSIANQRPSTPEAEDVINRRTKRGVTGRLPRWAGTGLFVASMVLIYVPLLQRMFFHAPEPWQFVLFQTAVSLATAGGVAIYIGFFAARYRIALAAASAVGIFAAIFVFSPQTEVRLGFYQLLDEYYFVNAETEVDRNRRLMLIQSVIRADHFEFDA